jgi:hypothetical protein
MRGDCVVRVEGPCLLQDSSFTPSVGDDRVAMDGMTNKFKNRSCWTLSSSSI